MEGVTKELLFFTIDKGKTVPIWKARALVSCMYDSDHEKEKMVILRVKPMRIIF